VDPRFNQAIDRKTGYHTQSMLCVPIRNSSETRVLGVIQMINKIEFDQDIGTFGDEDVDILETFSKFVGDKLNASSLVPAPTVSTNSKMTSISSGRKEKIVDTAGIGEWSRLER